jgi:hypothetical protein
MVKIFSLLGIIIFTTVLFGGFMYIKNFIFTSNPFFPIELKFFGKTIFKGLLDSVKYQVLIAEGDTFNLKRILFKEGLGVQFIALILPSMFLPVIFYRSIKTKAKPIVEYLILFFIPIIMLILYRFFINVYIVRYLFPYVSIGLVIAVIFINLFPWGKIYFTFVSFIAILASAAELAHRNELIISFILSLLLFITLLLFNSINQKDIIPYNAPDGLYRKEKSFQAWLNNLNKERIDYLFIALPFFDNKETEDPTKFPIEDEWASAHPENFQLVFKNSLCRIYRIVDLSSK